MSEMISLDSPNWQTRYRAWKITLMWNLKRQWHWWFGKSIIKDQWGAFDRLMDITKEDAVKNTLRDLMSEVCLAGHIEPLKLVKWERKCSTPSSFDPLAQGDFISVKFNGLMHTRKTWPGYIKRLIVAKI